MPTGLRELLQFLAMGALSLLLTIIIIWYGVRKKWEIYKKDGKYGKVTFEMNVWVSAYVLFFAIWAILIGIDKCSK
ncbi:MAG: hypothetical protein CO189_10065 [candidate division Zixibacteria bacterium CG_4_9_14_3_um_filter_46_8]|nr:MAG: hypothetical protein CO189_10065 [candidate division Zixibacteria bacterium CG_4_9_14_3_um_filter_46_8]